jgi:hypothetical protein
MLNYDFESTLVCTNGVGSIDVLTNRENQDWRQARHDRRLRQRRLPHGLREDVVRVRRDDVAGVILDLIQDRVQVEAEKLDGMITVRGEFGSWKVVMPVVERQILRALNQDQAFRGQVRNEIARLLRTEHLVGHHEIQK